MSFTRAAKSPSRKSRAASRKRAIKQALKAKKQERKSATPEAIARFEKRKAVVEAVQRGEAVSVVARVHGVAVSNVFRWLTWVEAKGMAGLRDDVRSGRPSKLDAATMQWLYNALTGGSPQQFYLEFALWTLAIVRSLLIDHKNIELDKSNISRLMKKLGLSPQVPLYRSYRQNKTKVNYYLKQRYPRAVQWAKEKGAVIFFADESRVRADGHTGTTWAPIGETPVIADSGDRFGINMISAVSARGQMYFECFEAKMESQRFIEFLRNLRHSAGKPVLVIVDGGSYHKSKAVKEFLKLEGTGLEIRLILLPPYSPELNPDEQVWNHAKRRIGKMSINSKKALKGVVERTLRAIRESVSLVRSFFKLPDTKYACAAD
ncbi:MAG TPA: IS630 family transposase [Chryseolinea sp.]